MREITIEAIEREKLIVIVRGVTGEKLIPLAEAMYDGGVRLMEITYSADGSTPDEITAENIRNLVSHFKGRMLIGAGTVLTEKQLLLTKEAGGLFVISPDANVDIIKMAREVGLVSIPGALTPTEIQSAHNAGADFVKLFPVTSLGTEYVKAVKAPLSHIKMLAVGGVTEKNIAEYLKVGINGFGLGSNIIDKEALSENNFEAITALARKFVKAAKGE